MGGSDNWHTPKQIKIEREGEPRGTRRGLLKKGERRKGKKARWDEVQAAYKWVVYHSEWLEKELMRSQPIGHDWLPYRKEALAEASTKYKGLKAAYVKEFGSREK